VKARAATGARAAHVRALRHSSRWRTPSSVAAVSSIWSGPKAPESGTRRPGHGATSATHTPSQPHPAPTDLGPRTQRTGPRLRPVAPAQAHGAWKGPGRRARNIVTGGRTKARVRRGREGYGTAAYARVTSTDRNQIERPPSGGQGDRVRQVHRHADIPAHRYTGTQAPRRARTLQSLTRCCRGRWGCRGGL